MGSIGMPELIVIFVVILMLFGSKKLPELARGLGQGIREFKRATNEFRSELEMSGVREEIDKGIKGNLDDVKKDVESAINTEPRSSVKTPGNSGSSGSGKSKENSQKENKKEN